MAARRTFPMPPTLPRITDFGDPSALAGLKRRVYFCASLAGAAVALVTWLAAPSEANGNFLVQAAPGLLALALALAVIVWHRLAPHAVLEAFVLFGGITLYAVQLLADVLTPSAPPASPYTLLALTIIAFMALSRRVAGTLACAAYGASVLAPWLLRAAWPAELGGQSVPLPEPPVLLLSAQASTGVILALLFGLSWFRTQLAREQATAAQLQSIARTDPLTGVANRHHMYDVMRRELQAATTGSRPLSVVLLDLDHFKRINDTHGHNVGDAVLRRTATLLREGVRPGDHTGRWGGEEFLLVLPGASLTDAQGTARRLMVALRAENFEQVGTVTASFGVATWRPGDTLERLVGRADDCLYHAKASGRDRIVAESDPHTAVVVYELA